MTCSSAVLFFSKRERERGSWFFWLENWNMLSFSLFVKSLLLKALCVIKLLTFLKKKLPWDANSFLFPAFLFCLWFLVYCALGCANIFFNDCSQIRCSSPVWFLFLFLFLLRKTSHLPNQMNTHLYSHLVLRGDICCWPCSILLLGFSVWVTPPFFLRGQSNQLGWGSKNANEGSPSPPLRQSHFQPLWERAAFCGSLPLMIF